MSATAAIRPRRRRARRAPRPCRAAGAPAATARRATAPDLPATAAGSAGGGRGCAPTHPRSACPRRGTRAERARPRSDATCGRRPCSHARAPREARSRGGTRSAACRCPRAAPAPRLREAVVALDDLVLAVARVELELHVADAAQPDALEELESELGDARLPGGDGVGREPEMHGPLADLPLAEVEQRLAAIVDVAVVGAVLAVP